MAYVDSPYARAALLLCALTACQNEYPGEELPDEGAFTTGGGPGPGTSTSAGNAETSTAADTSVGSTSAGPGTSAATLEGPESSSGTDAETEDGGTTTSASTSGDGTTSSTSGGGTSTSSTTAVSTSTTTSDDGGSDTSESLADTADATTEEPEDPVCGNGAPEAGEVCFLEDPANIGMGADPGPVDIVAGDFDNDGAFDVATANADGTVTILLGDGAGGFAVNGGPITVGQNPVRIRSGDLNGGTGADLVVLNRGDDVTAGTVSVLLSNGDGSFAPAVDYEVGISPSDLDLGRVRGPAQPLDFVVGNEADSNVSVFLNTGGVFAASAGSPYVVPTPPGIYPVTSVAIGEYGIVGNQDFLVVGANRWVAVAGNGTGMFTPTNAASPANVGGTTRLHRANTGSINGDVGTEVVLVDVDRVLVMFVNTATAQFNPIATLMITEPSEAVLAQVVGGVAVDVAVATAAGVSVFAGDGTPTLGDATEIPAGDGPATGITTADLNGDTVQDIILCHDAAGEDSITVILSDP